MSDFKHKDCPLCKLCHEVLGFNNCAQFANDMSTQVLDSMHAKVSELQEKLKVKVASGELSEANYELLSKHLLFSMGYAATVIAAAMTIDGPRIPPSELMNLIQGKIHSIVSTLIAQKLGINIENLSVLPIPAEADVEGLREILQKAGINTVDLNLDDLGSGKSKETDPKLN